MRDPFSIVPPSDVFCELALNGGDDQLPTKNKLTENWFTWAFCQNRRELPFLRSLLQKKYIYLSTKRTYLLDRAFVEGGMASRSVVEVVFPYQAADRHQISLRVGEHVTVIQRNPGGWWIGCTRSGEMGIFPASYTQEYKEKPKFNVPKELKSAMLQSQEGGGTAEARSHEADMRASLGLEESNDFHPHNPNTDALIRLKKECYAMERDIEKMEEKKLSMADDAARAEQRTVAAQKELATLKTAIRSKSELVGGLQKQLDELRGVFEEDPSAKAPVGGPNAISSSDIVLPPAKTVPPPVEQVVFDENSVEDPAFKKLVKKYRKRIAEADATAEEYRKQQSKLEKRIAKHSATIQELAAQSQQCASTTDCGLFTEELREKIKERTTRLRQLQEQKVQQEAEVARVGKLVEELEGESQKIRKRFKRGVEATEKMQSDLLELRRRNQEYGTELAKAQEEANAKRRDLAELQQTLADEQKAFREEQEQSSSKIKDLESRIATETRRIAAFEEELARLAAALAAKSPVVAASPTSVVSPTVAASPTVVEKPPT